MAFASDLFHRCCALSQRQRFYVEFCCLGQESSSLKAALAPAAAAEASKSRTQPLSFNDEAYPGASAIDAEVMARAAAPAPGVQRDRIRAAGTPSIGRVAPPHARGRRVHAGACTRMHRRVVLVARARRSRVQDFRDGIADVVRPFAILAAVAAFGIALIPVTLPARPGARGAARNARGTRGRRIDLRGRVAKAVAPAFDAAGDVRSRALPRAPGLAPSGRDDYVVRGTSSWTRSPFRWRDPEEWLPMNVEFLPTATLAWCVQNLAAESEIAAGSPREEEAPWRTPMACTSAMVTMAKEVGVIWIRLAPSALHA